ncbi:LytR family transcriptional regulator [Paenisporosarcina cavernae]|uniref:LytR family transcriptional regulator n=2 Tax=Paenisporosarcina cavernae TaxID=2320858 RepID=A0A385YVA0_9BACL|nr:LytR family transcriptional regulator [Paenisporosarcina cavernae]
MSKWIIIASLFALSVVLIFGIFTIVQLKNAFDKSSVDLVREGDKSELRDEAVILSDDPISILLLGIEDYSSESENSRADTQLLVTLNPSTHEMTMVTIPRDTRVHIENAGDFTGIHKINSAYTYGQITGYGASKLQIETIEKLLNIPIDYFIAVKFDGFRDIVNALDGVDIDVKEAFWEENFYDKTRIDFKKGLTHLNGEEALAFVRMRERPVNSIYSRDERQRQFLEVIITQAVSAKTLFTIGEISDILGDNVQTDFQVKDLYALQKQYVQLNNLSIRTLEIEGSNQYVGKSAFYLPEKNSLEEVSQKLRNILALEEVENFETNAAFVNEGS